jgi:hypothetical protein
MHPVVAYAIMLIVFVVPVILKTGVIEDMRPCHADLISASGILHNMEIVQVSSFYLRTKSRLDVALECFFHGQADVIHRSYEGISICPSEHYSFWVDRLCLPSGQFESLLEQDVATTPEGKIIVYSGDLSPFIDRSSTNNTPVLITASDLHWIHPAADLYIMLKTAQGNSRYVFENVDAFVARKLSPSSSPFIETLREAREMAALVHVQHGVDFLAKRIRAESFLFDRKFIFVNIVDDDELSVEYPIVEFRQDDCIVCLDRLSSMDQAVLACGHVYHEVCIRKWLERSTKCPYCVSPARITDVRIIL